MIMTIFITLVHTLDPSGLWRSLVRSSTMGRALSSIIADAVANLDISEGLS